MPRSWNCTDPRAVVTSPAADCREVLHPLPHVVVASPGALAVGIYAFDSAMPLRYVPHSYEYAPTGWYAPLLAPGTPFSIAVTLTPRSRSIVMERGFQSLIADVDVDGVRAHPPGRVLDIGRNHEYVVHGYTTSSNTKRNGMVTRDYRAFVCGEQPVVISVSARVAKCGKTQPVQTVDRTVRQGENLPRLVGEQKCVRRYVHPTQPYLYGFRNIDDCTVAITLQTPHWLVKHRVLHPNDLLPAAWIDRKSSVYRWPGNLINETSPK